MTRKVVDDEPVDRGRLKKSMLGRARKKGGVSPHVRKRKIGSQQGGGRLNLSKVLKRGYQRSDGGFFAASACGGCTLGDWGGGCGGKLLLGGD